MEEGLGIRFSDDVRAAVSTRLNAVDGVLCKFVNDPNHGSCIFIQEVER